MTVSFDPIPRDNVGGGGSCARRPRRGASRSRTARHRGSTTAAENTQTDLRSAARSERTPGSFPGASRFGRAPEVTRWRPTISPQRARARIADDERVTPRLISASTEPAGARRDGGRTWEGARGSYESRGCMRARGSARRAKMWHRATRLSGGDSVNVRDGLFSTRARSCDVRFLAGGHPSTHSEHTVLLRAPTRRVGGKRRRVRARPVLDAVRQFETDKRGPSHALLTRPSIEVVSLACGGAVRLR